MQTQKLKLTNAILPGTSLAFEAGSQRITIQTDDLQANGELKIEFGGDLAGSDYVFPKGTYGFSLDCMPGSYFPSFQLTHTGLNISVFQLAVYY